jgi:hypothetical protein
MRGYAYELHFGFRDYVLQAMADGQKKAFALL